MTPAIQSWIARDPKRRSFSSGMVKWEYHPDLRVAVVATDLADCSAETIAGVMQDSLLAVARRAINEARQQEAHYRALAEKMEALAAGVRA